MAAVPLWIAFGEVGPLGGSMVIGNQNVIAKIHIFFLSRMRHCLFSPAVAVNCVVGQSMTNCLAAAHTQARDQAQTQAQATTAALEGVGCFVVFRRLAGTSDWEGG